MKKPLLALAAIAASVVSATAAVAGETAALQGWEEIGELRVASQKIMKPQVDLLAKYTKFPLLPMFVREGLGGCECGQAFGAPGQDAEIAVKLYANDKTMSGIICWPVAQGADAWRKANPGRKVGGAEPFFTADGRYACLGESDEADIARKAAAKGVDGGAKVQKGLLSLTLGNERFFSNIEPFIKEQAAELAKMTGEKMEMPEYHEAFCAVAKSLKTARVNVGASKNGLDIRIHLTAKDGDASKKALLEQTAKFPASIKAAGEKVLEFENGKARDGEGMAELKAGLAKVIPESASAKDPAFAARFGMATSEDAKAPTATLWLFCWRKDDGFHALARIPSDDLAAIVAGMMQMQMDTTGAPQ